MSKKLLFNGKTNITNDELNELPLGAFEGKVIVVSQKEILATVFEEIANYSHVGFDTETKPVFVKGQRNKVALMQIALPEKVFLIRLKATGITEEMIQFLENENIQKIGVGIRDDISAIMHIKRFKPAGFVELSNLTKQAGLEVESVKKLTGLVLGFRISKSAQTSNWDADQLDSKQITYAATDAWVCLGIWKALESVTGD
jgi:ribonuclease D